MPHLLSSPICISLQPDPVNMGSGCMFSVNSNLQMSLSEVERCVTTSVSTRENKRLAMLDEAGIDSG